MVWIDNSSRAAVCGSVIALTAIAECALLSRLYTRCVVVRRFGWDDALAGFAMIMSIATASAIVLQIQNTESHNSSNLSAEQGTAAWKGLWLWIIFYNLTLTSIKESVLVQYLRIFPKGAYRYTCYWLITVVAVHGIWSCGSAVFFCRPVSWFWTRPLTEQPGYCLDRKTIWLSNAAWNMFSDLMIALLPVPFFYRINIPKRQKYVLMLVFGSGGLVCIISALRTKSLYAAAVSTDLIRDSTEVAIWSSAEVNAAIFASCLPTIKVCFDRLRPGAGKSMRGLRQLRLPNSIKSASAHSSNKRYTHNGRDGFPYSAELEYGPSSYQELRSSASSPQPSSPVKRRTADSADMREHILSHKEKDPAARDDEIAFSVTISRPCHAHISP